MIKISLFLFLALTLFANTPLKRQYFVSSSEIKLSDITKNPQEDQTLFHIMEGRHTKRIKSSQLLEILKKNGHKEFISHHAYTQFEKKSPIDTSKISQYIKNYYLKYYKEITIKSINVHPRGYLTKLPKDYTIKMQKHSYLHKKGALSIKSQDHRQLFFDYTIEATVAVYVSKKDINRNEELSFVNSVKKSIILKKFRALPIQELQRGVLESKIHISKGKVLTQRDVESIHLVKRGAIVQVVLQSANIAISFSAKAVRSGKLGDTITVEKSNAKRLKVQVVGKNRVRVL